AFGRARTMCSSSPKTTQHRLTMRLRQRDGAPPFGARGSIMMTVALPVGSTRRETPTAPRYAERRDSTHTKVEHRWGVEAKCRINMSKARLLTSTTDRCRGV